MKGVGMQLEKQGTTRPPGGGQKVLGQTELVAAPSRRATAHCRQSLVVVLMIADKRIQIVAGRVL